MSPAVDLWLLLAALLLVFMNGFFVAAEFAIVKLRETQAEHMAETLGPPGRILHHVRSRLDAYLSACQLGITLASLGLGWIGEPAVAHLIEPLAAAAGIDSPEVVRGVSFAVAFTIISYLHIVLGELAPKSVAIRRPEMVSLWTATPLWLFYAVMYPFIWLLNGSALLLLRFMGFDLAESSDTAHSPAELKQVLAASHLHGELGREQSDILQRTLEFPELTVEDLMQPVSHMVTLDLQASAADNLGTIAHNSFSRYPVIDGQMDDIAGIVHIKDLFGAMRRGAPLDDLQPYLRDALIVPGETRAFRLFRSFRQGYPHFAVVDDPVGNVIGFVTLEDLLEAMVGHIDDEFRRPRADWIRSPDGSLVANGTLTLYNLEKLTGFSVETGEHTIGGLVLERLGRVPRRGDRLAIDGIEVLVLRMRGPTIARLQIFSNPSADPGT